MDKKGVKRHCSDDYIKYGFSQFIDKDVEKAQCLLCYRVLGNESLRPRKLLHHLHTMHPDHKDKDVAFFQRKHGQVKYVKLYTTGSFYKQNTGLVEASYYVALQIAKQKKPHTIGETLIRPCASKMVELGLGVESRKKLDAIPLSDDTIARRIRNMAQDKAVVTKYKVVRLNLPPKTVVRLRKTSLIQSS